MDDALAAAERDAVAAQQHVHKINSKHTLYSSNYGPLDEHADHNPFHYHGSTRSRAKSWLNAKAGDPANSGIVSWLEATAKSWQRFPADVVNTSWETWQRFATCLVTLSVKVSKGVGYTVLLNFIRRVPRQSCR